MKTETITKLNALNADFYESIAVEFSNSRSYPWKGWNKVLDHIPIKKNLKVLDIGCGNGRFALFMQELYSGTFSYYGIDSDKKLLSIANSAVKTNETCIFTDFHNLDIINKSLDTWPKSLTEEKYDLIVNYNN